MRVLLKILIILSLLQFQHAIAVESYNMLLNKIKKLEKTLKSQIGVSAIYLEKNRTVSHNQDLPFPMASVRKIPIAVKFLDMVQKKLLDLDELIKLKPNNWRPGSGFLNNRITFSQTILPLRAYLELMLEESDNTATDIIMQKVGGAKAVTKWLKYKDINGIRIDRTSLQIKNDYDGITDVTPDNISKVEYEKKEKLLTCEGQKKSHKAFLEDPQDTATPEAMTNFLVSIYKNNFVDQNLTQLILTHMRLNRNGIKRIEALLPLDVDVAHKGGTLGHYNEPYAITNDVAIITLPENNGHIMMSIFIKSKSSRYKFRTRAIASIARSIFDYLTQ